MARTSNLTNFLTDVSAAIKQKIGDNTPIPAANFDTEILSIETAGTYQDKTLSITTNGNYRLEPDQNFDAMSSVSITVNVPTGEDLETEISAQEEYITQLEAIVDTKSAGSGDGSSMNIFVQETEPATKKGLWLKTDKTAEHYTFDDDAIESETWLPDGSIRNIPYDLYKGAVVSVGNYIYLIGGNWQENKNNFYKYDVLENTYTKLTNLPYDFYGGAATSIGTDIYIFGSYYDNNKTKAYKYNTLTDTFVELANIPIDFTYGAVAAIGFNIYLFCEKSCYKYDINENTYTLMASNPYFSRSSCISVTGTDIYIFGANHTSYIKTAYKYNTLTNTYTKLANTPMFMAEGIGIAVGTDIYLFGGYMNDNNRVYNIVHKYNTLTNTYTRLNDMQYQVSDNSGSLNGLKIYIFGTYSNDKKVQCMQVESKTFENNSVVINQGRYSQVGYEIELYSNSKVTTPALYSFADAWFYTTEDGLITDIPSYYGDGTQWINFKNPPVEEVEE